MASLGPGDLSNLAPAVNTGNTDDVFTKQFTIAEYMKMSDHFKSLVPFNNPHLSFLMQLVGHEFFELELVQKLAAHMKNLSRFKA